MIKEIVIRFAVLLFCLFFILSGVWFYLFGEQMRGAGVAGSEVFAFLVRDIAFVAQVTLALVVVSILGLLIFFDKIRLAMNGLACKLEENERIFEEEKRGILEDGKSGIYEGKEKLSYVFSYVRDGVILLNRSRGIALLSKGAEEILGGSQGDVMGKEVGGIFKLFEGDREVLSDEYLRNGVYFKKHLRFESLSATVRFVDFTCVRLSLIQREDLGYMIVLHDLGEEGVEKEREGLLSSFASELRQPLELIGGSNVSMGALELSVLMENLLTSGLIERKSVNVSSEDVDLGDLINYLVPAVNSLALERQVSFEVEIKDDFKAMVKGDGSRIRQVVLNLFINAIKYTKSGGRVVVSLLNSDGSLIMHVQDTGIGIKTEDMVHLFEKFFVGENVPEEDRGLGLGLYVCRGLVDLMKGQIWVDSVEGRGTVASVRFSRSGV